MYLPDINVWLAVAFAAHVNHPSAKTWFDGLPNNAVCFFSRLTQQGFLRLATNPTVFGQDTLTLAEAWQKYDLFLSDPRVMFAGESTSLEPIWRMYTQHQSFSPKVWSDAYLAAFAVGSQLEMVTFDQAFTQYSNLVCTILK